MITDLVFKVQKQTTKAKSGKQTHYDYADEMIVHIVFVNSLSINAAVPFVSISV